MKDDIVCILSNINSGSINKNALIFNMRLSSMSLKYVCLIFYVIIIRAGSVVQGTGGGVGRY